MMYTTTPKGTLMPKQALHPIQSIRAPPRSGALTTPINCEDPTTVVHTALFWLGKQCVMIMYDPDTSPADPMPATARPRMNIHDVAAAAQTSDPASKMHSDAIKSFFRGRMLYSLPAEKEKLAVMSAYADEYHPMSATALK